MKWKVKTNILPELGDQRVITKFAWLPVKAINIEEDEYMIWLESYNQIQEYIFDYDFHPIFGEKKEYKWVTLSNWIIPK